MSARSFYLMTIVEKLLRQHKKMAQQAVTENLHVLADTLLRFFLLVEIYIGV